MPNAHSENRSKRGREEASAHLPGAAAARPRDDGKVFRDDHGRIWWAHEVSGDFFSVSGRNCLLLASVEHVRRVWYFPADWHSLSSAELLRLPYD
jgi:hypothetical protein